MQATDSYADQSKEGVEEMPASCILSNSPQFCRVLKQMSDAEDRKACSGMAKNATNMWKSMPAIKVTCFDDEPYNEQMLKTLENTSVTVQMEETGTTLEQGNLTTQEKNEKDSSSEAKDINEDSEFTGTSYGTENSPVDGNNKGGNCVKIKNVQLPRRCSKGFVISSQNSGRIITSTKKENNDSVTKTERSRQDYSTGVRDKLPGSEERSTIKSSLNSNTSCHAEKAPTSPSSHRRRFSTGAFSGYNRNSDELNNTELKNRKLSSGVLSNGSRSQKLGDRKQVTVNVKKKSERIDLSFKIGSTDEGQANQFRGRSSTYGGQTKNQRSSSTIEKSLPNDEKSVRRKFSEQQLTSDGLPRTSDEGLRGFKEHLFGNVGAFPREVLQTQELNKSLRLSEKRLPLVNNRKAAPGDENHSVQVSTSRDSSSLNLRRKSVNDGEENRQLPYMSTADVTQRLNLSPPRERRVGISKPLPHKRLSLLDLSTYQSLSKSETDMRSISSDDDDLEKAKRISIPTSPRERRRLSDTNSRDARKSLSVGGKLSLSKSETDLRKVVSDEERVDAKRACLSSPLRVRRASSPKPPTTLDMTGAASSPLSPRLERKIYLAAAKTEARLPARAKSRSDLQASSQFIIDQAEKELDKLSESLPHVSMEEVMKSWHTDHKHWNVVSSLVNPHSTHNASATDMDSVKNCRYIREGRLMKKKLSD